MAYVGRFDGSEAKHASPAMAAAAGGVATQQDPTSLPTSTKWSVLSSRVEGLVAELWQVVGNQDAYCVSQSNGEGPTMKAVRDKMLATPWAQEWENKRTMFSYGEEMSTDPLEAMFIKQLAFMSRPRRILEIGMFVGYGAAAMLEGAPAAEVVSLEIDPYLKDWFADCMKPFPQSAKRHTVMVGAALDSLPKLTGEFDLIFIDANKAEYFRYLELILEKNLLSDVGVIVADNILYNGYPFVNRHFDSQPARREFGNAIKDFNEWVSQNPALEQVVLPVRDGISLIRKRTKETQSQPDEKTTVSDSPAAKADSDYAALKAENERLRAECEALKAAQKTSAPTTDRTDNVADLLRVLKHVAEVPSGTPALSVPTFDVTGKYFVVTGSTSGLGRGIALSLAAKGASGVLIHGTHEGRGQEVVSTIQELAPACKVLFHKADLVENAACKGVIPAAVEAFGRVDGLVNSAALCFPRGSLADTSVELWDKMFDLNARATFLLTQAATEHMKEKGIQGSVVNIASIAANGGAPWITAYSASKAAVLSLTKTNAYELRPHRIRVNTINMGWCLTDAENTGQIGWKGEDWLAKAEGREGSHPFGRLMRPLDVACTVGHLLSDAATMLTGAVIDFAPELITGAYE